MKKLTFLILIVSLSFSASAQLFTFDWEEQVIKEGENMKGLNVINDTLSIMVGYNRTFLTTADQGETWTDIGILDPEYDFGDISINSSGLGYACARDAKVIDNPTTGEPDVYADGLLLKTSDFGATWEVADITELGSGAGPLENPNDVQCYARHFHSVEVMENNTVYLGVEWYYFLSGDQAKVGVGGVLRSTDGVNWTASEDNDRYPMAIEAATENVYYGGSNHLFKADVVSGEVTDIYDSITNEAGDLTVFISDITVVSEDEVYVVTTTNGFYKISDSGNWVEKLEGTGLPGGGNDMLVVNENVWLILGGATKSAITLDKGANWTPFYPGSTIWEIGGIMNDSIIALAKSNIYKCAVADAVAGTNTWISQEIMPNENIHKMHIIDDNNAILLGYGETLMKTSDAGVNWNNIETPELFVYGADYDFEGVSTVDTVSYAITKRMSMIDYEVSSDISDVYAHGLIYRTTDLWNTWELLEATKIGTGDDPAFNPNADGAYGLDLQEIMNVSDSIVYIGGRWYDSIQGYDAKEDYSNVFRSEDAGDSWTILFEDQGGRVFNHIKFLDEDHGFIVGNSFFRKTDDGGASFTDMYPAFLATGSPADSTIFLKEIEYVDANTWYLLSSVDGAWLTEDAGATYSKVSGLAGGSGLRKLDESTLIVLGSATKSKISWDLSESWHNCYPGLTIFSIGDIMNDKLVGLARGNIYKIPLADLEAPSSETDIMTFVMEEQTGDATIDTDNNTIAIEVISGTDPTALTPVITLSEGAKISPASEVEQDFFEPVDYTVTAEDLETTEIWTITVTIQVGLEEMTIDNIMLYPNPVKEKLFLDNLGQVERISIFSISGSSVFEMETPSSSIEIDMSDIAEGIYFVSFLDVEGGKTTRKFIKNK